MDEIEILMKALSTWGKHHQGVKCLEELGELAQALAKRLNGEDNGAQLAEEIADVEITLEQIKIAYHLEAAVPAWRAFKLKRLRQEIDRFDMDDGEDGRDDDS